MRKIECYFINPYDDLDLKKSNGIKIEESDAIIQDDETRNYCTRNEIIDIIRRVSLNNNLINSTEIIYADKTTYKYTINSENSEKTQLIINIPMYLQRIDPDVQRKLRILKTYKEKATVVRIKRAATSFLAASALVFLSAGIGTAIIKGVEKEYEANAKRNKEYEDTVNRFDAYEKGRQEFEEQQRNEYLQPETESTTTSSLENYEFHIIPEKFVTSNQDETTSKTR